MANPLSTESTERRSNGKAAHPSGPRSGSDPLPVTQFVPEAEFLHFLSLERKRTARSNRPFLLMLLQIGGLVRHGDQRKVLEGVLAALMKSTRDTDIRGWYRDGDLLGIIFTELGCTSAAVTNALLMKLTAALANNVEIDQLNKIGVMFYVYPQDRGAGSGDDRDDNSVPELCR